VVTPSVMVVLPTLGERLDTMAIALDSCDRLRKLLHVTVCVVAPSGATGARELATHHGAQIVDDPGTGMAGAINAALHTRSVEDYYVWLGDDDALVPDGVAALVAAVEADASAVVAFGHCEYIDDEGRVFAKNTAGSWAKFLLSWGPNLIVHPGTVMSFDALERIGGFSAGLTYALDLDVFLRLRKIGTLVAVPVTASQFRWHQESLTVAGRGKSSREAMRVKSTHLPRSLRPLAPLWHWPVAWASALAATRVGRMASKR